MFIYNGSNSKINEAVTKANIIVTENEDFAEKLINLEPLDMSTLEGKYILLKLRMLLQTKMVYVKVYYPWYRFSKAIGYFSPKKPYDINLNGYKLKRTTGSIVATLVHELVHMADNIDTKHSFGHGGNSSAGKENTAPYKIGNIAGGFGKTSTNDENKNYKKRFNLFTWFKKLFI